MNQFLSEKIDGITEAIKSEINEIDGMEVCEGLTEDEKAGLLPKAFLLAYEPLNDGSRLSYDIRNFQTGLRKAPLEHPFHDLAHSMLSKAVKTQMEKLPSV